MDVYWRLIHQSPMDTAGTASSCRNAIMVDQAALAMVRSSAASTACGFIISGWQCRVRLLSSPRCRRTQCHSHEASELQTKSSYLGYRMSAIDAVDGSSTGT